MSFYLYYIIVVIQTTEGRKNLEGVKLDVPEILRFALDDITFSFLFFLPNARFHLPKAQGKCWL